MTLTRHALPLAPNALTACAFRMTINRKQGPKKILVTLELF